MKSLKKVRPFSIIFFCEIKSLQDKTQMRAEDIWVPEMDVMSLTSVGETSKLEKEQVTIRHDGRVSVFKRY